MFGKFGIFGNKKNELILVFDLGSASVGGALVETNPSGVPRIIFSIRERISIEEDIDADRFLDLTLGALELITSRIYMARLGTPKRIFCVLSSPWYSSQTRVIRLEKEEPFVFTPKLADVLIRKEIEIFEKENLSKYSQEEMEGNKFRPIEIKTIQTTLNGYETPEPFNQKAKELEMTVFISISGEEILEKMEEVLTRHFTVERVDFSSFVMASFAVVRDMFAEEKNFLLADIGGEVTDISLIKQDILRESISFPMGRNFMIRGIASALQCTIAEAKSFISLYQDGHAEGGVTEKLEPVIGILKSQWLRRFQETLAKLSNDISLPSTIFIVVYKDLTDFFSGIMKTEQFSQYTLTEAKFNVIFLDIKTLHGKAAFDENATRDPFIIIESVYINRFSAII